MNRIQQKIAEWELEAEMIFRNNEFVMYKGIERSTNSLNERDFVRDYQKRMQRQYSEDERQGELWTEDA